MVKCVERIRNKSGAIIKYVLVDTDTNNKVTVSADELRNKLIQGFKVQNLKLSKTYAILMNDSAKLENTKISYCVQVKEKISAYKEMIAEEHRDLTKEEVIALQKVGGFYVQLDKGKAEVGNIKQLINEAVTLDLEDYTKVPFKGRLSSKITSIQRVDPKEANVEKDIDTSLSEYSYIVNAYICDEYGFKKQYRLLFNEIMS